MRPFVLSAAVCLVALGAARAQSPSGEAGFPQIPYGQTYRNFQLPVYQNGRLAYKLTAVTATGVSMNRAEVINLTIEIYDNTGKVTTTITSPKADIYSSERRMHTKNTVRIERTDSEATSQRCDFDLISKQYVMTDNVRVILKNFDASSGLGSSGKKGMGVPQAAVTPHTTFGPISPTPPRGNDSLLDSPGAFSSGSTNVGPATPNPPSANP